MTKHFGLKGRFFVHVADGGYRCGRVIDYFDTFMLIESAQDDGNRPKSQLIVDIMDIVGHFDDDGFPSADWNFFPTRRAMNTFVAWLELPAEAKGEMPKTNVLHLVPTDKSKESKHGTGTDSL